MHWVSDFVFRVLRCNSVFQTCVSNLCFKPVFQTCVSSLCFKPVFQNCVANPAFQALVLKFCLSSLVFQVSRLKCWCDVKKDLIIPFIMGVLHERI